MIQTSSKNDRLNQDGSTTDGPDLSLWRVHCAILEFLETAPVSQHSAHATIQLLGEHDLLWGAEDERRGRR